MKATEVSQIITNLGNTKTRNLVIVDYSNVDKWRDSLGWKIGIRELGHLVKSIAQGSQQLRRFYFGSDFGPDSHSTKLTPFSMGILDKAQMSKFEIITKPVKYIHDHNYKSGFLKKCNFDVEMAVDAIQQIDNYDTVIIFSGDGDIAYLLRFLKKACGKESIVFGARGHLGKEIVMAKEEGVVKNILYCEDFESRLDAGRFSR
jgi:uncharacterized LabA/DUF88 family protein